MLGSPTKRSVTIAGHETSISLEPMFWAALERAAQLERLPINALIARIDVDDNWARSLSNLNVGAGYSNWFPAVVLSKQGSQAEIGFENGSRGTLPSSGATMPKAGVGGRSPSRRFAGEVSITPPARSPTAGGRSPARPS